MLPFFLYGERCVVLFIFYMCGTGYIEIFLMYHCVWLSLQAMITLERLCSCRYLRCPVKLLDSLRGAMKVVDQWRVRQPSWGYAGRDCAMWQSRHVRWVVSFTLPPPPASLESDLSYESCFMVMLLQRLCLICEQITDLFLLFCPFFLPLLCPRQLCYIAKYAIYNYIHTSCVLHVNNFLNNVNISF